jgi:hypothetical protein
MLEFVALVTGSPKGEIYWQVVNTGREAASNNDLRGRIEPGTHTKVETAKYGGTHFVECFVVNKQVCVARSGPFVVKIP